MGRKVRYTFGCCWRKFCVWVTPLMVPPTDKIARRRSIVALTGLALLALVAATNFPWKDRSLLGKRFVNRQAVQRLGFVGYGAFDFYDALAGVGRRWQLARLDAAPYREYLRELALVRPESRSDAPRKHVVFIQLESVNGIVVGARKNGEPLMPFLDSLARDGVSFTNVLDNTATGRTTDGEFMVLTSQVPLVKSPVYVSETLDEIPSLPRVLTEAGYRTASMHGYTGMFWRRAVAHADLGFEETWFKDDLALDERIGWGWSDEQVLAEAARMLATSERPMFLHVITLTNHHPYHYVSRARGQTPAGIETEYQRSIRYLDDCLESFFAQLDAAGIRDDCLVAIFGDHDSGITTRLMNYLDEFPAPLVVDTVPLVLAGFDEHESQQVDALAGLQDLPVMVLEELGLAIPRTFVGNSWGQWGQTTGPTRGTVRVENGVVVEVEEAVDHEVLTKLAITRPAELLAP